MVRVGVRGRVRLQLVTLHVLAHALKLSLGRLLRLEQLGLRLRHECGELVTPLVARQRLVEHPPQRSVRLLVHGACLLGALQSRDRCREPPERRAVRHQGLARLEEDRLRLGAAQRAGQNRGEHRSDVVAGLVTRRGDVWGRIQRSARYRPQPELLPSSVVAVYTLRTPPAMSSSLPGADQAADGEHERLVCLASWAASLAEHDPTWRSLHDEKQHGWASGALDWWWRENDKQYAQQDRSDKVGGTPGTAKYVRFYSQWLPRVAPEL